MDQDMNQKEDIAETISGSLGEVSNLLNQHVTSAMKDFKGWVEESPEIAVQVALGAGFLFGATGLAGLTAVAGAVKWLSNIKEWIPSKDQKSPASSLKH